MDELITSFRQAFVDRLKNRFAGAFAITWCLWNWDSLLILFLRDSAIEDRIAGFKQSVAWYDFAGPVLVAAIYLAVSPWVSYFVDVVQDYGNEARRRRRVEQQERELDRQIRLEDKRAIVETKRLQRTAISEAQSKIEDLVSDELKKATGDGFTNIDELKNEVAKAIAEFKDAQDAAQATLKDLRMYEDDVKVIKASLGSRSGKRESDDVTES